ncbi:23S rRNA pseudouridine(2604) synthase RluF [Pontibacter arcticus]|uniref:Pseudouridine synthase n=1 Tax=Pontibacter arcticus TaxID=2080288 RepID=A0A364RFI8_9BACT|nr:23S rRNA pseudouridine(2604) synthase RluF [Pontibacter arcticus]RAU83042.1 23S rRNA pseudouridine(2604) synthase RluF [Pontibacter arcticus]
MEPIRLNKFISESGTCSRREADKLIEQGRVLVNGKIPGVGSKVTNRDKVMVDGKQININEVEPVYLALNKPAGIETTTDLSQRDNIIRFVNYPERIFPIGRLDKDSEGLIFLTNNGDIVNKILRAGNKHEKEYIVTVDKPITPDFITKMGSGVSILGVNTKKCFVAQETPFKFRIILTQGMNRQIRRMCEALNYEVVALQRIRIMNITLTKLPLGQWRYLTESEIEVLHSMVSESTKTEEGSIGKKKAASNTPDKPARSNAFKPRRTATGSKTGAFGKGNTKSSSGKSKDFGNTSKPGKSSDFRSKSKSASGSRGAAKGGSGRSSGPQRGASKKR